MNLNDFTSPSKSMLTKVVCSVIISFENTPLFDLKIYFMIHDSCTVIISFNCHLIYLPVSWWCPRVTPGWCWGRRSHASPPGEACSHSAQILQLRAGATEKQQVVSGKDEVIFYLAAIKYVFVWVWVTHHDILF